MQRLVPGLQERYCNTGETERKRGLTSSLSVLSIVPCVLRLYQPYFELRSRLLKLDRLNEFIYARKNATLRRLPAGLTAKWSQ